MNESVLSCRSFRICNTEVRAVKMGVEMNWSQSVTKMGVIIFSKKNSKNYLARREIINFRIFKIRQRNLFRPLSRYTTVHHNSIHSVIDQKYLFFDGTLRKLESDLVICAEACYDFNFYSFSNLPRTAVIVAEAHSLGASTTCSFAIRPSCTFKFSIILNCTVHGDGA